MIERTPYSKGLDDLLTSKPKGPLALDIFAGCGGLALGFEAAGFQTLGYEMDKDCCATYRHNLHGECHCEVLTPETKFPNATVVIGGPPCQPFSVGGHQHGLRDSRDGFPIFIAAIDQLQPDIWLFENVRGLWYSNKWYFEEIVAALGSLNYIVEARLLNAVNYGVPQNRERVIVVGHRGEFHFPEPLREKVTVQEALGSMMLETPPESKFLTPSMDAYVARYEKASMCIRPRDLHPAQPARTLTCRNLAGATGDMQRVKLPDGRRRRLLVREAAQLQSFPSWFQFSGGETSQYNQIGNSVAPLFARRLAASVKTYLASTKRFSPAEIIYRNLPDQLALPFAVQEKPEMEIPDLLSKSEKKPKLRKLLNEALFILTNLGIPVAGMTGRQLEKMAMAFLAIVDVRKSGEWSKARVRVTDALKSRDIINYINAAFEEKISSGSYDDIRRKDLKLPVVAGIIVASANKASSSRNDPTRGFSLAPEYLPTVQGFGLPDWQENVQELMADRVSLAEHLEARREINNVPVRLPTGEELVFSPGEHNQLQKAIIEVFLPRYGYGAQVLYVGDTAKKFLVNDEEKLRQLKFFELGHGELPDVIAYSSEKNWLYLIEAFHSTGPISAIRLLELRRLAAQCTAEIVYVTAFPDRAVFRKNAAEIAWETEVWIADAPDHLVHFDGEKFLGPYKRS